MKQNIDTGRIQWWLSNLEGIDRELARLAMLCRMGILDLGIIDRILQVRERLRAANSAGLRKLRNLLMLRLTACDKSVDEPWQLRTAAIEQFIVERFRGTLPELGLTWPPA